MDINDYHTAQDIKKKRITILEQSMNLRNLLGEGHIRIVTYLRIKPAVYIFTCSLYSYMICPLIFKY